MIFKSIKIKIVVVIFAFISIYANGELNLLVDGNNYTLIMLSDDYEDGTEESDSQEEDENDEEDKSDEGFNKGNSVLSS